MNGGTLALMIAGLVAFGAGAYLAAVGDRAVGISMMSMGLIFQAITLGRLRAARRNESDAG